MDTICLEYTDASDNNIEKSLVFSKSLLKQNYKKESLFVSKVNGQSMQPHIMHDALVVADLSNKTIQDKAIYLLYYENNMWIKQASYNKKKEEFEFVSINPEYAHLVYGMNEVHVIARVLLTFTSL